MDDLNKANDILSAFKDVRILYLAQHSEQQKPGRMLDC